MIFKTLLMDVNKFSTYVIFSHIFTCIPTHATGSTSARREREKICEGPRGRERAIPAKLLSITY